MQKLLLSLGLIAMTATAVTAQDFGYDSSWNTQQRYIDQMWLQQDAASGSSPSTSGGGEGLGGLAIAAVGIAILCAFLCETEEATQPVASTQD